MNQTPTMTFRYQETWNTLVQYRWRVFIPCMACTVIAFAYAVGRPQSWRASQAILVREEAAQDGTLAGRFSSTDAMKTFQETIQEMAKNPKSLSDVLRDLSPSDLPRDQRPSPKDQEIEELQAAISITAPKGAEFGSTEVIYVSVTGKSRQESLARTKAVCDGLERQMQQVRDQRYNSIVDELQQALGMAEQDQALATQSLETMEREVGTDLGELRTLNESGSGDSNLRTAQNQIRTDLRAAQSKLDSQKKIYSQLYKARQNPDDLVSTPNALLEAQPGIRRLKDGLVDAQLRKSELLGKFSENHPQTRAAVTAVEEVRRNLFQELDVALHGLNDDVQVSKAQVASLEKQLAEINSRLTRLASMRARYGNLVAALKQTTAMVEEARQKLGDARASQVSATSASLLTRVNEPVVGNRPLGPSKSLVILGGAVGGLAAGLGLLILTTPLGNAPRRRWSDMLPFGRRSSDQSNRGGGNRQGDSKPAAAATAQAGGANIPGGRRGNDPLPQVVAPVQTVTAAAPVGRRNSDPPPQISQPAAANGDRRRGSDRRGHTNPPTVETPRTPPV